MTATKPSQGDNQVLDRLADYQAGKIDWPTLRDWLATHQYVKPQRYDTDPHDNKAGTRDWDTVYVPGSWDDVQRAWAQGIITEKQMTELNRQMSG